MLIDDEKSFPQLDFLIHAYLNQDYELSGDSIEAVVECYSADISPADRARLLEDIGAFRRLHADHLDEAFRSSYGLDFAPALWGIDAAKFFDSVDELLSNSS